ncbi:MAG: GNAT family N-acetyltransferase [Armatimonadota bacterium]
MADMLVSLLNLPNNMNDIQQLNSQGINIRRINNYERSLLRRFILEHFSQAWADEVEAAFSYQPVTCFIATHEKKILGFAAYECTRRDFFGPTGVHPDFRGKGIGKALLIASLRAMLELGYAYAIIGGVGPAEFYSSCVGAIPIPNSTPGVYTDMLDRE